MSAPTTVKGVLLAAARHLEKYGWRRDDYGARGRRCCLMGAIYAVQSYGRITASACRAMSEHGYTVVWNDRTTTSGKQVIAALRRVAKEVAS